MANPFSKKRLEGVGTMYTNLLLDGIHPNEAGCRIEKHLNTFYGKKCATPEEVEYFRTHYRTLHGIHAQVAKANEGMRNPLPPEGVVELAKKQAREMYKALEKGDKKS
ncbi:MAG: hypothetical protein WCX64_02735 [Candidatus Micrarchaeia archaeon]